MLLSLLFLGEKWRIGGVVNYDLRREKVRGRLAAQGIDLLAVGPSSNMRYLLGYVPHPDERPCLLLLTPEGEALLVPDVNLADARAQVGLELASYSDEAGPGAAFARALGNLGIGANASVALDGPMRTDFALLVLERTGWQPAVSGDVVIGPLRLVKEADEVNLLRASAACADTAMEAALEFLRPGVKESEIAAVVRDAFARAGSPYGIFTLIGAGPNGAFPHHEAGDRSVVAGDAVVIDIGASRHGYFSDITRMAVVGDPPSGYEDVHEVVERAVEAALEAARPGARVRDVDAAARSVIADAGFGEHFPHRTGHGLGLEEHEPPFITRTGETRLEEGMVFSIEPGVYLPGRFGVRLEEIVVLEEKGPAIMSRLGREAFGVPG